MVAHPGPQYAAPILFSCKTTVWGAWEWSYGCKIQCYSMLLNVTNIMFMLCDTVLHVLKRVLTCRVLSGQIDYLLCTQVHGRANKLIIAMGYGSIGSLNIEDRCFYHRRTIPRNQWEFSLWSIVKIVLFPYIWINNSPDLPDRLWCKSCIVTVTHCLAHYFRPHQLFWGDQEMVTAISYMTWKGREMHGWPYSCGVVVGNISSCSFHMHTDSLNTKCHMLWLFINSRTWGREERMTALADDTAPPPPDSYPWLKCSAHMVWYSVNTCRFSLIPSPFPAFCY